MLWPSRRCRPMKSKVPYHRLAGIGALLSLIVCYGTLGMIGVLGALGIAVAINNTLWAGAIVAFAGVAVVGLGLGLRCHGKVWPIVIGAAGAAIIAYVMLVQYDRVIEFSGFILLSLAAFWDWRLKR